jgi:4-diphosphocytidyl-2-C-methyl-D-erythritol kinase
MTVRVFAPAKINFCLHVTGRRADGYHQLDSLVAFADIGDRVTARPAPSLTLAVTGPEAAGLAGEGDDDNLVLRAARLMADHAGIGTPGAALHLEKNLPVASGIGGGSSDAAATLRALCELWRLTIDKTSLARLGARLGADLPVCLHATAAWVGGVGERVDPIPDFPRVGIVLANPRRGLITAAVFQARSGPFGGGAQRFRPTPPDATALAAALAGCRNDLTEAAVGLVPEIAGVLAALERLPGALIARMSGSGATCFALFADRAAAVSACALLAGSQPRWWCAAGGLVADTRISR